MNLRIEGKKCLVTGGTRGIGRSIATALARAGGQVLTCYRQDSEAVADLERELKEISGDHHLVRCDVSRPDEVARLAEECRDRFGSLDVVVNNAGSISHVPFAELTEQEWHRVLDTNLGGAFQVVRRTLPLLGEGGSIVNVGSRAATIGIPLRAHYTASKAGLIGLTRSLAKELGPRIRVNMVAPGPIDTGEPVPEAVRDRYRQMIPLGRLGRPDEIAAAVLFLASDLAAFVNGETINVDGGI